MGGKTSTITRPETLCLRVKTFQGVWEGRWCQYGPFLLLAIQRRTERVRGRKKRVKYSYIVYS